MVEHASFLAIHSSVTVWMVLLETHVKMWMNVLKILVNTMEHVRMGSTLIVVTVLMVSMEIDVKETLMTVMELSARTMEPAWIELIVIPADVQVD